MDDPERTMQIQIARDALATVPDDPLKRAVRLLTLGKQLGDRYDISGVMNDLEESIQVAREAIGIIPEHHQHRSMYLSELGVRLRDRYGRLGAMTDLEEALQNAQECLDITPESFPARPYQLLRLGVNLQSRYQRTGATVDLEKAIQCIQEAVQTIPKNSLDRATMLKGLSLALEDKFLRTRATSYLEQAIQVAREAVQENAADLQEREVWMTRLGITPGDPERARLSNNLGKMLKHRYHEYGAMVDLQEVIQTTREAIGRIPNKHADRTLYLYNLGIDLREIYLRTGAKSDLEEAIQFAQQAVDACPENYPHRAQISTHFGLLLEDRYIRHMTYLEEAIELGLQINRTSAEDQDQTAPFNDDEASVVGRSPTTGGMVDLELAILHNQAALHQASAPTLIRIEAAKAVVECCSLKSDWQGAYDGAATGVHLIPTLISRSLPNSDKQHMLRQIFGLACDACAVALHIGKSPLVALKLLEQGRGVLAASLEEMQTELHDLQVKHPKLADELVRLRDTSEPLLTRDLSLMDLNHQSSSQAYETRQMAANHELEDLIFEIRRKPGFDYFLLPSSEEAMETAARRGPIVVVNVSKHGCDALIIQRDQIQSIPLPHLRSEEVEDKAQRGDLGTHKALSWLWDTIANPVLEALGFIESPSDDNWPHIWWIPTGLLSKFPLHAAGRHSVGCTETVLDRVMSSYSSSIKAIIQGRGHRSLESTRKRGNQALFVAMQETEEHTRLHFAIKEVEMLQTICKSMDVSPKEPERRCKHDVLAHLPDCEIFHFADHGYTDDKDPSQSSLLLDDWKDDKLTVATLLEMDLRQRSPFLAYLSACGTGEIKDERFYDESIHLISACQLAGFRHVIGTLWEVNDESCVDMARITYEGIRDGAMTDDSVCLGLHKATRALRERWLRAPEKARRGSKLTIKTYTRVLNENERATRHRYQRHSRLSRQIVLDDSDEEDDTLPYWVPYVHFGV